MNREILDVDVAEEGGRTGIEQEEIEGEGRIVQPFDPNLIRVETRALSLDILLTRIREREIDLTPDFQRKAGIWTDKAQSRLIESILIRIPLPAFFFDATNDDRWLVVDGLQRLSALRRFVLHGDLKLTGLDYLSAYENSRYSDLPRSFQRRINETTVTVYLIDKGTPPEVKFNIFERINTGGLPLSSQEIRHALNQGKVTAFLKELAASDEFKGATDRSISDDRMADRECVLRFLAFSRVSPESYSGDLDIFLNKQMQRLNSESAETFDELGRSFRRAMDLARGIFGNDAFRKRYQKDSNRHPISKALFEAWAVSLGKLSEAEGERLVERREDLKKGFIKLMNEHEFEQAISQGTGDALKVRIRFQRVASLIQEVLIS